jgi:hypothetical protein
MVVYDDNLERKQMLIQSLHEELARVGVAGQAFSPKPAILNNRTYTRNKYETREGVRIEFDGSAETRGVKIPPTANPDTGYYDIHILSRGINLLS